MLSIIEKFIKVPQSAIINMFRYVNSEGTNMTDEVDSDWERL